MYKLLLIAGFVFQSVICDSRMNRIEFTKEQIENQSNPEIVGTEEVSYWAASNRFSF